MMVTEPAAEQVQRLQAAERSDLLHALVQEREPAGRGRDDVTADAIEQCVGNGAHRCLRHRDPSSRSP